MPALRQGQKGRQRAHQVLLAGKSTGHDVIVAGQVLRR